MPPIVPPIIAPVFDFLPALATATVGEGVEDVDVDIGWDEVANDDRDEGGMEELRVGKKEANAPTPERWTDGVGCGVPVTVLAAATNWL